MEWCSNVGLHFVSLVRHLLFWDEILIMVFEWTGKVIAVHICPYSYRTCPKIKGGYSMANQDRTVEQALAEVNKTTGARKPRSKILAQNDPATPKGYINLGKAGFPTDGKPHSKDNRGEGSG